MPRTQEFRVDDCDRVRNTCHSPQSKGEHGGKPSIGALEEENLELFAREAIEKAFNKQYREAEGFFINAALLSKDKKKVLVEFALAGESRELTFVYSSEWKSPMFIADLSDPELKKFFSLRPRLVIGSEGQKGLAGEGNTFKEAEGHR